MILFCLLFIVYVMFGPYEPKLKFMLPRYSLCFHFSLIFNSTETAKIWHFKATVNSKKGTMIFRPLQTPKGAVLDP